MWREIKSKTIEYRLMTSPWNVSCFLQKKRVGGSTDVTHYFHERNSRDLIDVTMFFVCKKIPGHILSNPRCKVFSLFYNSSSYVTICSFLIDFSSCLAYGYSILLLLLFI